MLESSLGHSHAQFCCPRPQGREMGFQAVGLPWTGVPPAPGTQRWLCGQSVDLSGRREVGGGPDLLSRRAVSGPVGASPFASASVSGL